MRRILLFPLVLLSACSEMPKFDGAWLDTDKYLSSYHLDIRQGNFVTQEMVSQLKPGLTREQVRYLLGTPLLTDLFHENRWDYVYRYDSGQGDIQQRHLSVYFEDNKLARVGGDVVVADPGEGQKPESGTTATVTAPVSSGEAVAPDPVTTPPVPR